MTAEGQKARAWAGLAKTACPRKPVRPHKRAGARKRLRENDVPGIARAVGNRVHSQNPCRPHKRAVTIGRGGTKAARRKRRGGTGEKRPVRKSSGRPHSRTGVKSGPGQKVPPQKRAARQPPCRAAAGVKKGDATATLHRETETQQQIGGGCRPSTVDWEHNEGPLSAAQGGRRVPSSTARRSLS